MRDFNSNIRIILLHFFIFCAVSCGATLPLQEVSTAKQEITKAKKFSSERFAKSEYDESKLALLQAHDNAFNSKPNLEKVSQLSQVATKNANSAIRKSLPSYIKELQNDVKSALESANIAFADSLATEFYEQATLLKIEGDEIIKQAEAKLKNLPNTTENSSIYDEYETGIKRYNESILASEKAKDLSLAQTQSVIDSTLDIETDLDLIDKYSKDNKELKSKTVALREEYKISIELMESGNLRDGFKNVEKIRTQSNSLMAEVILPYAKERIKLATLKIEEAEKHLNTEEESTKSSLASDNLVASKEAFTSSVDLLAKERYYDSIQQSDEAIRLAQEVLQSEKKIDDDIFSSDNPSKKTEESATSKQTSKKDSSTVSKTEIKPRTEQASNPTPNKITSKWKRHVVSKKNPPETLWRIAADKKYLGDKERWKEIYEANKKRIPNPDLIFPNQVILIPADTEKTKK